MTTLKYKVSVLVRGEEVHVTEFDLDKVENFADALRGTIIKISTDYPEFTVLDDDLEFMIKKV